MNKIKTKREKERESEIMSAKRIIKFVLKIKGDKVIKQSHIRRILSEMIFKITEADGLVAAKRTNYKKNITYISLGVKKRRDIGNNSIEGLIHDHVYMRKGLVNELLNNQKKVDEIVKKAVSCIVTKEEHDKLTHNLKLCDGWERYKKAKIKVFNTRTRKELKF